jgi:hypothetical protein
MWLEGIGMVKESYIKIIGPPFLKAIKALEEIAGSLPEVCIMDTIITNEIPRYLGRDLGGRVVERGVPYDPRLAEFAFSYFSSSGVAINRERCQNIISSSGISLGEFDFVFEWSKELSGSEYIDVVERIDEKLSPLGCMYLIHNK